MNGNWRSLTGLTKLFAEGTRLVWKKRRRASTSRYRHGAGWRKTGKKKVFCFCIVEMKVEKLRDESVLPVLPVKWYEYTKWVMDRVDGFPKNQRFVLGTRLADSVVLVVLVVELLAEAAYAGRGRKKELLAEANRKIEVTRWLVRLAGAPGGEPAALSGKCQGSDTRGTEW